MLLQFSKWFNENAQTQLDILLSSLRLKRFFLENYDALHIDHAKLIDLDFEEIIKSFANQMKNSSPMQIASNLSLYGKSIENIPALQRKITPEEKTTGKSIKELSAEKAKDEFMKFTGEHLGLLDFSNFLWAAMDKKSSNLSDGTLLPVEARKEHVFAVPENLKAILPKSYLYSAFGRGALNKCMLLAIMASNNPTDTLLQRETRAYFESDIRISTLKNIKKKGQDKASGIGDDSYALDGGKKIGQSLEPSNDSPDSFIKEISNKVISAMENRQGFRKSLLAAKSVEPFLKKIGSGDTPDLKIKVGIEVVLRAITLFVKYLPQANQKASMFFRSILDKELEDINLHAFTSIKETTFNFIDGIVKEMDDRRNEKIDSGKEHVQKSDIKNIYSKIWEGLNKITGKFLSDKGLDLPKIPDKSESAKLRDDHNLALEQGKKLVDVTTGSGMYGAHTILTYDDGHKLEIDGYPPDWLEELMKTLPRFNRRSK
jgi:hypothetical protein